MTDDDNEQAKVKRHTRISPVWLIPVAAILIGFWLLYQNVITHGPEVILTMDTAQGLKAGSTPVKVNSVQVGHVQSVRLTDDYSGAVADIRMNPGTQALLATDSRFWVVKPRIGRQGISGLGTLLSGAYIELIPGKKKQTSNHFKVLGHPPVTSSGTPGISLVLTSDSADALNIGDPVVYLGQEVGLVENATFSVKHRRMRYNIFIKAPYSQVITNTTQFWLRSGIDLHVGANGVDLRTGSLQTIVTGGVTFGQPDDVQPGAPIDSDAKFKLYSTRSAALQDRYDWQIDYVLLLSDSVRGLSDGAPVLYRGIRIGTVKQVPYFTPDYRNVKLQEFRIPVLIAIQPQRISNWLNWNDKQWRKNMQKMFKHGLRASIESANLLTGAQLISLHFMHDAPEYEPKKVSGFPIFPSTSGTITSIQQQISALLGKFNDLKISGMVEDLQKTLAAINATTRSLNQILGSDETQQLAAELNSTLSELQKTLAAYQKGAPVYDKLGHSLDHLNRILQNLEPFVETLNKNPNALVFGVKPKKDPVPKAAQ